MNMRQRFCLAWLMLAVVLVPACTSGTTGTPEPAIPIAVTASPQATLAQPTAATTPAEAAQAPTRTPGIAVASKYLQVLPGAKLATVNGQTIMWSDYEPILSEALHVIDARNPVNWDDPAMQVRLKQLQNTVLEQAISRVIMRQLAAKEGVTIPEADLETAVQKEKSAVLSGGKYSDWDTFLKDYWLTDQTFRQTISDKLLMDKLQSAQQVETQAQQVHVRHILFANEAQAQEAEAKLKAGGDFAQLAAQYSQDTQTKDNGGDLGWFVDGSMIPEIWDVVVTLQDGQFSDVLNIRGDYFIIQVLERATREVDDVIRLQRQQAALQDKMAAETAAAQIERLVNFTATPTPAP